MFLNVPIKVIPFVKYVDQNVEKLTVILMTCESHCSKVNSIKLLDGWLKLIVINLK